MNLYYNLILFFCFLLLFGCAADSYRAFPAGIQKEVNHAVSFSQVLDSPPNFQGTVVMWGGEILFAKRFKDHTRLTLLQLPLTDYQDPSSNRTDSQGRFIAFHQEFLDPATVPPGTRITLIGVVTGSVTEPLDEMDYTYPTIVVTHLKVWPEPMEPRWYGPYGYGPYWYGPYYPAPYWGRHGRFYGPHPYWW